MSQPIELLVQYYSFFSNFNLIIVNTVRYKKYVIVVFKSTFWHI